MQDNNYNGTSKKTSFDVDEASVKLNFTDDRDSNALFFEHEQKAKKKEQSKKNVQPPSPDKEEFSLPPKYTINKRYNTSRMIVDEAPKVRATYMPKFTEASQNYRITEEKRPRKKFGVKTITAQASTSIQDEKVHNDPTTDAVDESVELNANVIDTSVATPPPAKDTLHSTVYKFESPTESTSVNEEMTDEVVEEQAPIETETAPIVDELSADFVFGSGNVDFSNIEKFELPEKDGLAESLESNDEAEELETSADESQDEAVDLKEEEETLESEPVREYSLPDPEPIIIDVPAPSENSLADRVNHSVNADTIEVVGDDSASVGKTAPVEYTAFSQRDSFKDKFLDAIMSVKVRLIASLAILVLAFFVENLSLFGINVASFLGMARIPAALAVLDIQIVIALFLLVLPEIVLAFRRMFLGRATPEIFIPVSFVFLILYYVAVILISPSKYPLFGLVFAVFTVGAILAAFFRRTADFSNFKTVSRNSSKSIVDRKFTRTLPEESVAVDGKTEIYKSKTARVFRAAFISDFFKRCGKCFENSSNVLLVLISTFGAAFVGGVVAFFVADGLISAVETFITVFMLGIPAFSLLTHKLSYYHSSLEAMYENSAVIGESTLYDYSGVDVVTFQDTEVFGADDVSLQRIVLFGKNENLTKALQQMTAIFSVVGGPLENLFAGSVEQYAAYATDVDIEDDGVLADVFGSEVRAGSYEYMRRHGITIPESQQKENSYNSVKVMYAAENGEVYAKFYIRYTLSEEFVALLPMICDEAIVPLVYTRDPNVNIELFKTLTAGTDIIRVLKKHNLPTGDDRVYHRVSAGLVTMGDKNNIVNMILLSKKYVRFQSKMAVTEVSSMIVGCILAVLISLGNMLLVPSVILAAWQAAWCVALYFMSKHALRTERRSKKTTKKD